MPHDPFFEERISNALKAAGAEPEHKRMFGGVAFMVKGNMALGITNKGDLMVRFDGARHEEILQWPGAKPMSFGHKGMKGFLFVDADAVDGSKALDRWVRLSLDHVNGLPAKTTRAKSASKKRGPGAAINKSKGTKARSKR